MPSVRKDFPSSSPRSQRIAFDNFAVDLRSGEVRKNGARIRLQAQPFQLLGLLLENVGEVVPRERAWGIHRKIPKKSRPFPNEATGSLGRSSRKLPWSYLLWRAKTAQ